ncbi:MAG: hypothetical protein ACR2QM_18595, partial [Longimicrobiales bacterium]
VFAFSEVASAQTAQPWSIQASGLVHGFDADRTGVGPGLEVQVRRNLSAFSFGVGADHTWNSGDIDTIATISVSVLSLFVEPRYVIDVGRDRVAPYLSARVGVVRESRDAEVAPESGLMANPSDDFDSLVNGGGGILINVKPTLNVDLGFSAGKAADITNYLARIGFAMGFGGR